MLYSVKKTICDRNMIFGTIKFQAWVSYLMTFLWPWSWSQDQGHGRQFSVKSPIEEIETIFCFTDSFQTWKELCLGQNFAWLWNGPCGLKTELVMACNSWKCSLLPKEKPFVIETLYVILTPRSMPYNVFLSPLSHGPHACMSYWIWTLPTGVTVRKLGIYCPSSWIM